VVVGCCGRPVVDMKKGHRPFPHAAQPLEDIQAVGRLDDKSRGKMQNVLGDSLL
jgi:hypothetical protein